MLDGDMFYQDGKPKYEFEIDPNKLACHSIWTAGTTLSWPANLPNKILVVPGKPGEVGVYFSGSGTFNFSCHVSGKAITISDVLGALFEPINISTKFWRKK